jgi:hypothetical protein
MELDDIKRHALAARQFQVTHGEGTFTLTMPTKLQSSIAYAQAMEASARVASATSLRFNRALLLLAITTWSGVLLKSALPDIASDEQMEFEPGAVELLLDAQPDLEKVLFEELMSRFMQRSKVLDTAEKN